jgi:NADH-quinone oxidoreductase subunit L
MSPTRLCVTFFGATTAFFAATVGLVQNDIKRVIAYSTCSQLGYMFVALGVGAYGIAIFHLFTHAFFKALLFLGAGSVIHAMSDEQDMRKMGGSAEAHPDDLLDDDDRHAGADRRHPGTLIGRRLLLQGRGHRSAFAAHNPPHGPIRLLAAGDRGAADLVLFVAADVHDLPRQAARFVDVMNHVHESPPVMTMPLFILAVGALLAGIVFKEFSSATATRRSGGIALFRSPKTRS